MAGGPEARPGRDDRRQVRELPGCRREVHDFGVPGLTSVEQWTQVSPADHARTARAGSLSHRGNITKCLVRNNRGMRRQFLLSRWRGILLHLFLLLCAIVMIGAACRPQSSTVDYVTPSMMSGGGST